MYPRGEGGRRRVQQPCFFPFHRSCHWFSYTRWHKKSNYGKTKIYNTWEHITLGALIRSIPYKKLYCVMFLMKMSTVFVEIVLGYVLKDVFTVTREDQNVLKARLESIGWAQESRLRVDVSTSQYTCQIVCRKWIVSVWTEQHKVIQRLWILGGCDNGHLCNNRKQCLHHIFVM